MTTTLAPSLGHGALMTQQGTGTTPGFDAIDVRRMTNGDLQEGVLNASDFMVVQRAAGANMSVDIGMPAGGAAYVQGDTVSGQGLYTVPVHSATINETITAANATNPRVDQIILEVLDNVHDASGSNLARTRVLTGTATAGATLANRSGVASLPGSALLLADVLVGAAVSSVDNTKIRDRRKWARGGEIASAITAGATYTVGSSIVSAGRLECSGVPLRLIFKGHATMDGSASTWSHLMEFRVDGTLIPNGSFGGMGSNNIGARGNPSGSMIYTPSAGSHTFDAWTQGTASTWGVRDYQLSVEEIVRQNTANNTSTSG